LGKLQTDFVGAATQTCRACGYDADDHWAKLPPACNWSEAVAVATDRQDRVYVFNRGPHPVMIFDRHGAWLASWGEGLFVRPHGITIGPDDTVYCADDMDHTVRQFTLDGQLLLTLGTSGKPSDTGATSLDYRTIRRAGPPFHYPTNLAISRDGKLFVSDGYGNARVHKFSASGELLQSWGEPGRGPGQFHLPHGIAVDENDVVYVADRENSRIQLFTTEGRFLSQWTDVARPCQVFIDRTGDVYVAELGFRAGMYCGITAPSADATGGRVSIFDRRGQLKARWGGGQNPAAPGDFFAPHGICVDSRGDVYVAEVVMSAGGRDGLVSPDCHSLQKFSRADRQSGTSP
jgi:DNA-binding beta-propeller fold protein YncE